MKLQSIGVALGLLVWGSAEADDLSLEAFDHDAGEAIKQLGKRSLEEDLQILCPKEAEQHRLDELIQEHVPAASKRVTQEVGYIHRGFTWLDDEAKPLVIVPSSEKGARQAGCRPACTKRWSGACRAIE